MYHFSWFVSIIPRCLNSRNEDHCLQLLDFVLIFGGGFFFVSKQLLSRFICLWLMRIQLCMWRMIFDARIFLFWWSRGIGDGDLATGDWHVFKIASPSQIPFLIFLYFADLSYLLCLCFEHDLLCWIIQFVSKAKDNPNEKENPRDDESADGGSWSGSESICDVPLTNCHHRLRWFIYTKYSANRRSITKPPDGTGLVPSPCTNLLIGVSSITGKRLNLRLHSSSRVFHLVWHCCRFGDTLVGVIINHLYKCHHYS